MCDEISVWELGDANPELDKIIALAQYFNVSTDELLTEESEAIEHNKTAVHKKSINNRFIAGLINNNECAVHISIVYMRFIRRQY